MNYGSLGIVADLIDAEFDGWDDLVNNFRGKASCKKYPVEFTYYSGDRKDANLNRETIQPFMKRLRGREDIIFCSLWRVYIGFNDENLLHDKSFFRDGLGKFRAAIRRINQALKYEIKLFFVIDREEKQFEYVKNIMDGLTLKYGFLFNEIDLGNKWRSSIMRFDCTGWEQALVDTGMK